MQSVVFIPGIMGTELITAGGEKVWPPTPTETVLGYKRADKLLDPTTRPGEIIQSVASCFNVYGSILREIQTLGFTPTSATKRLYAFPYDWRLDLELSAAALAKALDRVHADGATEIFLIAHSMGGLVARLVLERAEFRNRPWFPKITLFAALATPHLGAPLALARVLGLDSSLGVSAADFRRIAADRRYPSGYQLLPSPGEDACWNQSDDRLRAVDFYSASGAARLGMDPVLVTRRRWLHDALAAGQPPETCRYFYFAGTGHKTVTRVNVVTNAAGQIDLNRAILTKTPDAGDGTVPFWSALPRSAQKQTVVNEHASVFTGTPFLSVFRRLLGGAPVLAVERLGVVEIAMSTDQPVQEAGLPIELLLVPAQPLDSLRADVTAERIDEAGLQVAMPQRLAALAFSGADLTQLRLDLPGITEPGHYRLHLSGDGVEAADIVISVTAVV